MTDEWTYEDCCREAYDRDPYESIRHVFHEHPAHPMSVAIQIELAFKEEDFDFYLERFKAEDAQL